MCRAYTENNRHILEKFVALNVAPAITLPTSLYPSCVIKMVQLFFKHNLKQILLYKYNPLPPKAHLFSIYLL